jgi:hypothetical protein
VLSTPIITSPDIATNDPAGNTAIMTIGRFVHACALVVIDPPGCIRRSRTHGGADTKDYERSQSAQDRGFHEFLLCYALSVTGYVAG